MNPQTQTNQQNDINASFGAQTAPGTLHLKRLMPADIETVWSYLTESEKSAQWLAAIDSDMKPGHPFTLAFNHNNITKETAPEEFKNHDSHKIHGEVLVFEPFTKFSYSWKMGETATEVIFELTPQGSDTLLSLTHRKLPGRDNMLSVGPGWHAHLDVLISRVKDEEPGPFWSKFLSLKSDYAKML